MDADVLNSMAKLELLIVANHDLSIVDVKAAENNNVTVYHVPDLDPLQLISINRLKHNS